MRKIVHLSDVHFGTADPEVTRHLIEKVNDIKPNLVVVSGDLTQRARSTEFKQAKHFLDQLPQPQIIVPGNHDVPLYNIVKRFYGSLSKYQKYITDDLTPAFIDDEIAVVGINSARSLTIKGGRINEEQIEFIRSKMIGLSPKMLKVIVTHHPFDLPEGFEGHDIVGRANMAMPRIVECGADVFLAGHLHVSHIETTAKRYRLENGRTALIIQAGTATSARVRGEANSFNLIEVDSPCLLVERLEFSGVDAGFAAAERKHYEHDATGWNRVD